MNTKDLLLEFNVSSRANRRKAALFAIELLEHVRAAEEYSISRFPLNFQDGDAFANAECSIEVLSDAIACLGDAY